MAPIARYCDTIAAIPHIARYLLREVSSQSQNDAILPLALSFTQPHRCHTPCCNISRDNFLRYPMETSSARKRYVILSLQVSCKIKSIAAGPLSQGPREPLAPDPQHSPLLRSLADHPTVPEHAKLGWAKSRKSNHRITRPKSNRRDSNHQRSLVIIYPRTQKLVLIDLAFIALRFESRDWRS